MPKRMVVRFPARAGNFSHHHRLQNGSEAHSASYSMGTRGSFPGGGGGSGWSVKLTIYLHVVPRSKNAWSRTSNLPICLHGVVLSLEKHRDHFTFMTYG
jgi:hypothetical protein